MNTKTLLIFVIFLLTGWAFAQPVLSVQVDEQFEEAKTVLEQTLNEADLSIHRFLDVGQTIRNRDEDFMPFGIYVLEPSELILNAIEEDARLAAILPESFVIYEQNAHSHIAFLDFKQLLHNFEISDETETVLVAHFDKIEDKLSSLGLATLREQNEITELPYRLGSIPDEDLEGSMFFYSSIYQDQNMNLVGEIELGSVPQAWLCNASIAKQIFEHDPNIGVIAPCRIFAYKEDDSVVLGMVNPDFVSEVFPTLLENEATRLAFETMKEMGDAVFLEMGVE